MGYLEQAAGLLSPTNPRTRRDRISNKLNATICELHRKVGNVAGLEERFLVVGAGAMQVLSASIHALCDAERNASCPLYTKRPFWGEIEDLANVQAPRIRWMKSTNDLWASDAGEIIEIITSPNNPDGRINVPTTTTTKTIYDSVYDWPSFPSPGDSSEKDPAIQVFSLSKLAGYAASRVGWALIKDKAVAEAVESYIFLNGQGAGVEAQYRAARVLKAISNSVGTKNDFFAAVRGKMNARWRRLEKTIEGTRFSIDGVSGQPFAWLRCKIGDAAILSDSKLRVSNGTEFGAPVYDPHIRLITGMDDSTFDNMLIRLAKVARPKRDNVGRISVHQHVVPPDYFETLKLLNISIGDASLYGTPPK